MYPGTIRFQKKFHLHHILLSLDADKIVLSLASGVGEVGLPMLLTCLSGQQPQ